MTTFHSPVNTSCSCCAYLVCNLAGSFSDNAAGACDATVAFVSTFARVRMYVYSRVRTSCLALGVPRCPPLGIAGTEHGAQWDNRPESGL